MQMREGAKKGYVRVGVRTGSCRGRKWMVNDGGIERAEDRRC